MAPAKKVEEVQEEEYMDDLITLVHDNEPSAGPTAGDSNEDVELIEILDTNSRDQEVSGTSDKLKLSQKSEFIPETSAYGRKHLGKNSLTVNFFDSSRNVRLLSECRPLSVLVVDYVKHPPRKSRVFASKTRKPPYRSYLALQKSSKSTDGASNKKNCCTLKQNNVLKIVNKTISADTLSPVDRQITKRDGTKKNVSEMTRDVNKNQLKPDTKKFAVAPKTTVVTKMTSNIDFKKNKGLVGLKITNRILKPVSEEIPNVETNNFIGFKVLKAKCEKPKPSQIKKLTKPIKTGNNDNAISNNSDKNCKTKTEKSRKTMKSKDHKRIKSSTNLVKKTVVSCIKYNCKNQMANMVKLSPALSGEENMQASENEDSFTKSSAKVADTKKPNEVSLKCKLKLDPKIASKFINKINDEAHIDQMHSNKHLSKELKVEIHSNGKSTNGINICNPTTKAKNNDKLCDEHTKGQKNNVTKQGDLKVQTVSQINNSVGNPVSSEIITKHSNLNNNLIDNLILSKPAQIPKVIEIITENEIKKELNDNSDSSEIPQNIVDKTAAQQRTIFDDGIAEPVNIVKNIVRDNNEVIRVARDPILASCYNTVDPHLLPPSMQKISDVKPVQPNVSSVRRIPSNVNSVRPIPPHISSVRPIPPNVSSVRPVPPYLDSVRPMQPNQIFASTLSESNVYEVNNPNNSHINPQFWTQPNANLRFSNHGFSKRSDQQFLDQALLNKDFSANTNLPLDQRLAPTNEMHYQLIPPWQYRNDPININIPSQNISAYNNPQNPIAEVPMQWQQSVQSQNQTPFDMFQRNYSHIGPLQTCSYNNSYLSNIKDDSYNLLRHEDGLRPPPPPQTLGYAMSNKDTHINPSQKKNINNSPKKFKNASLIAAASQKLKPEEGPKILGTSKRKVSAGMDAKQRTERNLVYVSSLERNGNTAPLKLNLKRAGIAYNRGGTAKTIRLIPPQTSANHFFRLTPDTCCYNSANPLSEHKGYSPPILPIPTLSKSIELMRIVNAMQNQRKTDDMLTKSLNNPDKTHVVVRRQYIAPTSIVKKTTSEKIPSNKPTVSTHEVKKISLEEYKRRTSQDNEKCIDLTLDEKKQSKAEGEVNKLIHDRVGNVERKSLDSQDLGYDSDITVKL